MYGILLDLWDTTRYVWDTVRSLGHNKICMGYCYISGTQQDMYGILLDLWDTTRYVWDTVRYLWHWKRQRYTTRCLWATITAVTFFTLFWVSIINKICSFSCYSPKPSGPFPAVTFFTLLRVSITIKICSYSCYSPKPSGPFPAASPSFLARGGGHLNIEDDVDAGDGSDEAPCHHACLLLATGHQLVLHLPDDGRQQGVQHLKHTDMGEVILLE